MRAFLVVVFTVAAFACAGAPAQQGAPVQAERLYRSKCTGCHRAYSPSSRDRAAWAEVLTDMAPKAKLSEGERALVLEYLQANAKDAVAPGAHP